MTPPLQTLTLDELATATGGWRSHLRQQPPTSFAGFTGFAGFAPPTQLPGAAPAAPVGLDGATTPDGRTASSYRQPLRF